MTVKPAEERRFEKLVVGIIGASLSANGWLLASRVSDVSESLKEISSKIGALREEQASIKAEVMSHTITIAHLEREGEHSQRKDN